MIKKLILSVLTLGMISSASAVEQIVKADIIENQNTAKNFIQGNASHFEKNVGNWTSFADPAATTPDNMVGGSATVTCTRTATTPLSGEGSLLITKDANDRQGQGCSKDFSIDNKSKNHTVRGQFSYAVASGTFADGDINVWVYDVTNSKIIPVTPSKVLNHLVASEPFTFEFPASNSGSYRLGFFVSSTSASAYSIKVDEIKLSSSSDVGKSYGSPVVATKTYTPGFSGLGTGGGTATGSYSRVGDKMVGNINFTKDGSAGSGGAAFTVSLPSGHVINTALVPVGSIVGSAQLTASQVGSVYIESNTTLGIYAPGQVAGGNLLATGLYQFSFSVPILGWDSSTIVSSDADTRIVAATYTKASGVGISNASLDTVVFDTKKHDTHSAYNTSTGLYTVPVAGKYRITAFIEFSANSPGHRELIAFKNTESLNLAYAGGGNLSSSIPTMISGSATFDCIAGDTLQVKAYQDAGGTLGLAGDGETFNHLHIERISGPSQIAASETVGMRYRDSTGTTYPRATNINALPFATKDFDTHGAYNPTTGDYTVPVSGKYQVMVQYLLGSPSQITAITRVMKNGNIFSAVVDAKTDTVFNQPGFGTRDVVDCKAGDVINIGFYYNDGGGTDRATIADGSSNFLSILKVGN